MFIATVFIEHLLFKFSNYHSESSILVCLTVENRRVSYKRRLTEVGFINIESNYMSAFRMKFMFQIKGTTRKGFTM